MPRQSPPISDKADCRSKHSRDEIALSCPMNPEKTSPDWEDHHLPLKIDYFPIERSADNQRRCSRWKRIANTLVVSLILYFIAVIAVNLSRQCYQPLSQSDVEKIILDFPTPSYLRSQSYTYTSGAHLAGRNQTQATFTRDLWESYGIQTEIEEYEVLLNYPLSHRLALFHNESLEYEAELREDVIPEDATSANPDEVPTFHGYSANGNVTGGLVYANFGHLDDFRLLEKNGVNVSGKVVLMRYEYGAIGAILYSDPHEDGDLANATQYPNGPGRHPSAVQRGTVLFLSKLPGDPSTPGFASKPGVRRTDPKEYIPSIPSLPISFRDAMPFLKSLNGGKLCGSTIGHNWSGSLNGVEYCVENADTRPTVNLINEVQFLLTPIYNVIGRIPGKFPEEIILGNHRDAWVYGAGDPISGTAPMNAVVGAFGRLIKRGWKPRRTLVFASWDAEEYGLVGSTEWVEDHSADLTKNTLAYLNVDIGAVGNRLNIQASPLLDDVLIQATKDVITDSGSSVYDIWKNTSRGHPAVGVLGSGSDYTGFLQLLGIASSDMGFAGSNAVYQYHSNYDSFYWMDNFGDPGWHHHQQIAQMWGLVALRLASAPIVGFNATAYANKLQMYLQSLRPLLPENIASVVEEQKERVDLKPLKDAVDNLGEYARHLDSKAAELRQDPVFQLCYFGVFCFRRSRSAEIGKINEAYLQFERGFVGKGLPGRPVYKHVIYAPGMWEGYAGFTLPSIREALAEHRWREANEQVIVIADLIRTAASKDRFIKTA